MGTISEGDFHAFAAPSQLEVDHHTNSRREEFTDVFGPCITPTL